MKAWKAGIGVLVALSLFGATLPGARGAPPDAGALTPQGCIDDNDTGADVCPRAPTGSPPLGPWR